MQKKVGTGAGVFYYTFTDHLGNVIAMSDVDGTPDSGSNTRYSPFGAFETTPPSSNPSISNHGFTGHRHNNTGANDLGLIYMNARYYLPEVGRFISADTIVPEPKDPQSYNRYSYALNSPTNYTDPTGHCTSNYEAGSLEMEICLSAWNSVSNYLFGAAFGPGGSGHFPNELISDWLANADISTLENLMQSFGIEYGYVYTPSQGYFASGPNGAIDLSSPVAMAELCQYWQGCYQPATDYTSIVGPYFKIIHDDFGNWYFNLHFATTPSVGIFRGDINVSTPNGLEDISDLAVDMRQEAAIEALTGIGTGFSASWYVAGTASGNPRGNRIYEMGLATQGIAVEIGFTWLIFHGAN